MSEADSRASDGTRARHRWILPLAIGLALLIVMLRQCAWVGDALREGLNETAITHDMVVEKIQSVAKLVSSEATLRDVVVYENTWYGSTKRSLVVVTARVLAGMDLDGAADVQVDDLTRRITITIPEATILAVEIVNLQTYDEQRGLWNPFRPADRDAIHRQVRVQLARAAREMKLTERANESARQMLETMFTVDGWTAQVAFREPLKPLDR